MEQRPLSPKKDNVASVTETGGSSMSRPLSLVQTFRVALLATCTRAALTGIGADVHQDPVDIWRL